MEVFKGDMEGMLEKMQDKCNEFGSPGNFESDEMKLGWNDCMQEANEWLENNFPQIYQKYNLFIKKFPQ